MSKIDPVTYFHPNDYRKWAPANKQKLESTTQEALAKGTLKLEKVAEEAKAAIKGNEIKSPEDWETLGDHLAKVVRWEKASHKGLKGKVKRALAYLGFGKLGKVYALQKRLKAPPPLPPRPSKPEKTPTELGLGDDIPKKPDPYPDMGIEYPDEFGSKDHTKGA